jgi:ligand-binding sensor domain-containing protein/signal transduction histidine kinase
MILSARATRILQRLVLLLGSICAAMSGAAGAQYRIESWTTDAGLPQNTITSIQQTPDGYLWLATLDGLARFDGVRFTIFNKNNSPGIESNRFAQMIVDGAGDLWARYETGGVVRGAGGKFQTFNFGDDLNPVFVWRISLDQTGAIVAAASNGFHKWDGARFAADSSFGAPATGTDKNAGVVQGKSGALWRVAGTVVHRLKNGRADVFPLPGVNTVVSTIVEDRLGRLWIGTSEKGKLFVLENDRITAFELPTPAPNVLRVAPQFEDRDGNLWIADDDGVVIISAHDQAARITAADGLSDKTVGSIYQDREGSIWVGTLYRGLNRLSRQSVAFYSAEDGLRGSVVHPIFQTRSGDVWIGGENLTRWRNGAFSPIKNGENYFSKSVTAIEEDRAGRVWLGGWNSVLFYENEKLTVFNDKFSQPVNLTDIHEDRTGALWFAAYEGVFRWQNETMTHLTVADGLAGDEAKVIHESFDGTIWIGTYGGLTRIAGGAIQSFTTKDGLTSNLIRSLYEDASGTLWIGSYDGGLSRFKNGKFTGYTSNDGLFNDGVFQILEDAWGNLWMSSNRGIYRVAKQELDDFADGKINRIKSIAYSKADGLLETECNGGQQPAGIEDDDGKLWFPTQRGVAVIDPQRITTNPIPPPVAIETIKIDNESLGDNLPAVEIAPGKNNLEINYTGLSFVKPEFVKFRYRLDGLDKDWIEAGTRRAAYYSYLPPGDYVFRVAAANSDGVWNETGKQVRVKVLPPFYRTLWFVLLTLALGGGAMFVLYRRRVSRLEQAQKSQEEFSRRLLASQEQERQRIAAELHDSIGQSLLIIKNRAFLALSDLDEPETVREQLEELSESAAGAIEECREISYNLRPYQISRFGLTKTLEAIFNRITEVTDIKTSIKIDSIDNLFSPEAETNIYRIVQESVNNIIKHSSASKAELNIERRGGSIEILIRDDGRGFDQSVAGTNGSGRGGFGLIGIAERARMLGGVYEIESQPGNGTRMKITLIAPTNNERN